MSYLDECLMFHRWYQEWRRVGYQFCSLDKGPPKSVRGNINRFKPFGMN